VTWNMQAVGLADSGSGSRTCKLRLLWWGSRPSRGCETFLDDFTVFTHYG